MSLAGTNGPSRVVVEYRSTQECCSTTAMTVAHDLEDKRYLITNSWFLILLGTYFSTCPCASRDLETSRSSPALESFGVCPHRDSAKS